MFAIEKGIDPPKAKKRTGDYNFDKMEIGDSIFFAETTYDESRELWAAQKYFRRTGGRMAARKENGGIRIWRLS
jgi:hypothetical protein